MKKNWLKAAQRHWVLSVVRLSDCESVCGGGETENTTARLERRGICFLWSVAVQHKRDTRHTGIM